jgi:hypothetical protein
MPAVLSLMGQFTEWLEMRESNPNVSSGKNLKTETLD